MMDNPRPPETEAEVKSPAVPTLDLKGARLPAPSVDVVTIFPSEIPPESHAVDWFMDLKLTDDVEKLFKHLYEQIDEAELGPIKMREGVDETTTPSAMEHLRRIDRQLEHLDHTSMFKIWFGEKAAAWHSQAEQLRRKNFYLRERLTFTHQVFYESEYSRFRLRWLRHFTTMITNELVENGRSPESLDNPKDQGDIYQHARTWLIRERGIFAQDRYDALRRELWSLESEIGSVVKQAQSLNRGGAFEGLRKRGREIERERIQKQQTMQQAVFQTSPGK
jgi:hypothetical protein